MNSIVMMTFREVILIPKKNSKRYAITIIAEPTNQESDAIATGLN